ncbi:hypothetical protein [Lacisediminihabitans changchengi]|uniref:DUF320 domain-containing protein n=1 Tax=Lacisediminihabitans changchengi TaxID=2787634 RepID=A0A934W3C0_9MICO|nr:hypothetical protein [Lacisediminihabitans changchengi]MBK4348798.1 hypothetical protein [Lacisediminihabitans changchengi]
MSMRFSLKRSLIGGALVVALSGGAIGAASIANASELHSTGAAVSGAPGIASVGDLTELKGAPVVIGEAGDAGTTLSAVAGPLPSNIPTGEPAPAGK